MSYDLDSRIAALLKANQLDKAIEQAENELRRLSVCGFHSVLGRNLLDHLDDLLLYLDEFYTQAFTYFKSGKGKTVERGRRINPLTLEEEEEVEITIDKDNKELKAICYHIYNFQTNDHWNIPLLAYDFYNSADAMDGIIDGNTFEATKEIFIRGFEDVQKAFDTYWEREAYKDKEQSEAADLCDILVILRVQQLFRQAYLQGKELNCVWTNLPLLVTAHEQTLLYNAAHQ